MNTPKRIQMTRKHPWRADNPDAVIVARKPGPIAFDPLHQRYGNPFTVLENNQAGRRHAVDLFAAWIKRTNPAHIAILQADLRGKDLACWCPLDQPCHADVLLELANGELR